MRLQKVSYNIEMSNPTPAKWPPEGHVAVGEYAFAPPYIPTELQVEQAEEFVFSHASFEPLQESDRRRNVIRLAIAAASDFMLPQQGGRDQKNYVPLIGGIVEMTTSRHEGSPIISYTLLGGKEL